MKRMLIVHKPQCYSATRQHQWYCSIIVWTRTKTNYAYDGRQRLIKLYYYFHVSIKLNRHAYSSTYLCMLHVCTQHVNSSVHMYIALNPSQEANSHSACPEILNLLWNLKVHYCRCHNQTSALILSQMNQNHAPTLHFWKYHFSSPPINACIFKTHKSTEMDH